MKMAVYIDYVPTKNGYCYGILGENGYVKWNTSIFASLDKAKEAVYTKYTSLVNLHINP